MNYYRLLFVCAFALAANLLKAQDVITLSDDREIQAKVLEVTDQAVKYKKFDNQDGPTYSATLKEVKKIKYKNGSEDVFNQSTGDKPKSEGTSDANKTSLSNGKKFDINDTETAEMVEAIAKNAGDKLLSRCSGHVDNSTTEVFYDQVYKDEFSGEVNIPIIVKWDKGLTNKQRWIKGIIKIDKEGNKKWFYQNDSGILFSGCAKTMMEF